MSSSISRTDLEAMDREELVEHVVEMSQDLERVDNLVRRNTTERLELADAVDDLTERVAELEAENERLRERINETTPNDRDDRLAALVKYAANQRGSNRQLNDSVIKLTPKEMAGATGYSKRHCYDLVEEWSDEYAWLLSPDQLQRYGDLERDTTQEGAYLTVDFEGVHSPGVPLNQFNNARGGEGQ